MAEKSSEEDKCPEMIENNGDTKEEDGGEDDNEGETRFKLLEIKESSDIPSDPPLQIVTKSIINEPSLPSPPALKTPPPSSQSSSATNNPTISGVSAKSPDMNAEITPFHETKSDHPSSSSSSSVSVNHAPPSKTNTANLASNHPFSRTFSQPILNHPVSHHHGHSLPFKKNHKPDRETKSTASPSSSNSPSSSSSSSNSPSSSSIQSHPNPLSKAKSISYLRASPSSSKKPLILVPRDYAHANRRRHIDLNDLQIKLEPTTNWKIYERIGRGKYSEVFEGKHMKTGKIACVKILKPRLPKLLKLEIYVLQQLAKGPNIIQLLHCLRDDRTDLVCLVFEILKAKEFKSLLKQINDRDLRFYLYQMLRGLDYAHSQGIMHRDIKPQNILVDTESRIVRLIDWGLAAFYYPRQEYSVRVATRAFKAPELLVGYSTYHYGVDLFAFGCMIAGIVFRRQYFFHGSVREGDQLKKIMQVLGTNGFNQWMKKYNLKFDLMYREEWPDFPRKRWNEFRSLESTENGNKNKFITEDSIDLIDKLLRYDPDERLTAREAMKHRYFDKTREEMSLNGFDEDEKKSD